MEPAAAASPAAEPASLIVTDPGGHRTRVPIAPLPFLIGRQPQSNLILRDSRVSRTHARIVFEHGGYVLEDTGSRHGIFVNGQRIDRQPLANSDRIDFGAQDSYQLLFMMDGAELRRLMEQVAAPEATPGAPGLGGGLARLRAVLDLARTLQGSFSLEDVLVQVVDTALAVFRSEATPGAPGLGGGLARLRAVLDLARTLQGSFSLEDVLVQVVDTALAVT